RAEEREDERGRRSRAGGEEERVAAVELAEQPLGLLACGVAVPLVVGGAWLAVGEGGGAVERRRGSRAGGTHEPRTWLHEPHRTRASPTGAWLLRPPPGS